MLMLINPGLGSAASTSTSVRECLTCGPSITPLNAGPVGAWDWFWMSQSQRNGNHCPQGYTANRLIDSGRVWCERNLTGDLIADRLFGTPPVETIAPVPSPAGPATNALDVWTPEQLAAADQARALQERDVLIPMRASYELQPDRSYAWVDPGTAQIVADTNEALVKPLDPTYLVMGGVAVAILILMRR